METKQTTQQADWLGRYHAARRRRPVLTPAELRAAMRAGLSPEFVARDNDRLADEYDA